MKHLLNLLPLISIFMFPFSSIAEEREPNLKILEKGVQFTLVAEHPDLVTPTGVDVDSEGRIWVVASHTHFPPEDYNGPKFDEILIFENGKRSVFYNNTHHTMDLELGKDGWVYLAERSRIFRIKDTDSDGKADLVENLAVLDTEADYPHNGLAGLAWDLNGDLIFCLGENYSKPWTMTAADKTVFKGSSEGGVFRIKPDGKNLQRIAKGLWNPFGICVRSNGEMFAIDNDPGERPPCRMLQIVQGGDYGFQRIYGSEAHHPFVCWNGELRGTLPMLHPVGEAPCGIVTLGNGVLVPSWGDHHVCYYPLNAKGASYSTQPRKLLSGSRYFRPACIAPDKTEKRKNFRTLYVTDWVDGRYNVHGYGRLWKLEIDLSKADWTGSLEIPPQNQETLLAKSLRSGEHEITFEHLLALAETPDPFVAQSAIEALSKLAPNWKITDVSNKSTNQQISMLLALSQDDGSENQSVPKEKWIDYFLTVPDSEIQFETLRWISNASLKKYLANVEQILAKPNLDFRLFEAAIATRNMLTGMPEKGVRDEEMLLKRVQNANSSPKIRAYALRLLPAQKRMASDKNEFATINFPKGLSLKLLSELIDVGDNNLNLETIRTLAGNPQIGQKLLVKLASDKNLDKQIRAEAIVGLSPLSSEHKELFLDLSRSDIKEIREEALRGLRQTELDENQKKAITEIVNNYPDSKDLAEVLLNPESLTSGRPSLTDINGWNKKLESVPGKPNLNAGRRLFHHSKVASCSTCHRHQGRGNTVGPDLSSVNTRKDHLWLLKSILQPSSEMSPEFRPSLILLNDGRQFTGIRLQSYTKEAIRDNKGLKRVFDRSEIELIQDLDKSFMPDGLPMTMTDRELRDLVAFLEQQLKIDE